MAKADKSRQSEELSPAQVVAVELVATGRSDGETAEAAGVTRQTVNGWRHHDPAFIAAVNAARREMWSSSRAKLRALASRAVDMIEDNLKDTPPPKVIPVLLAVMKLAGELPEPDGATTTEGVIHELAESRVRQRLEAIPMSELDRVLSRVEKNPDLVQAEMDNIRSGK